jgi:two-component system, cell cycle sensor histidine kinase and response regulator CckA
VNEVGCRVTKMLLEVAEREGIPAATLLEGLSVPEAHLRDGRRRVDWTVWVHLVERLQELRGVEALREMGVRASSGPELHDLKRIAGFVSTPTQLYKLNARWAVSADFRHFRATCDELPHGRLRIAMSIDPHHRGSTAAFELATGVLRGVPILLGLPVADVVAHITPHGGTWEITPPRSRSIWARASRAVRALVGAESAIEQLGVQQQEILFQYRELEAKVREQRRVEAALRTSKERWQTLAENAPAAIFVVDANGTLRSASRPFGGRSTAELFGADLATLFSPEHRDAFHVAIAEVLRSGTPSDVTAQGPGGEGLPCWYAARIARLEGEGDDPCAIVLCTDVSEAKRAESALRESEERLRQAQKMEAIGRLAGGVAHDFNNLLTVVLSYSTFALSQLPPGAPLRDEIGEIKKAGERAADLTRQLLAFSRQQVLRPSVLDLNDVVRHVDKMLRRLIGEDIAVVMSLGEDLGRVKLDRGQIEQVILNLVVNARDAMPDGGTLSLETANAELDDGYAREHRDVAPGPHVMLVVSDTGSGMDRPTQARIFEPFFTTKDQGKGTGLGLSTVRGIVQQSGGSIWVYSEPGVGTTFRIYFPRVRGDEVTTAPSDPLVESVNGSETILLVEDEAQVRSLARRVLEERGYRVLEASTPREALTLSREHRSPIDLLVTDVIMPGMNGRDLAGVLGTERAGMPVLYMSGYAEHTIVSRGVVAEGVNLLQKPFTPDALAHKVRRALDVTGSTPIRPGA